MIWRTIYNALDLCQFMNPEPNLLLQALEAATGISRTSDELVTLGRRVLAVKQEINCRRGMTRSDDRLPDGLLQPLADGGTQGAVPDLDRLLAGAYEELGQEA